MRASSCLRVVEPAAQPVTDGQMRAQLRQDTFEEDALVTAALAGAAAWVEEQTRRALITQTWTAYINCSWREHDPVMLPRPRLIEISALEYRKADDSWNAHTGFRLMGSSEPACIWLTSTPSGVATPDNEMDAVWRVTYTCGYGAAAKDIPRPLQAAIKLMAAHLFENREAVIIGTTVPMALPLGVERLIAPYRVPWGGPVI